MTDRAPVIRLDGVSVSYRVYESRPRIAETFTRRSLRRRVRRVVPALKSITLELRRGESIGVIGPNGAGKSTLLRVMAGLQPIDRGSVFVAGNPRLLGVQAAMKGSWTARQSIEVGLIALGLRLHAARERVEEVAQFADLVNQLDLPVSSFSSGMRARLYFSISTEVSGGTLLIDEALATGDKAFRKKATERLLGRLDVADSLVLVSHSIETIAKTCERAVLIERGKIIADGPAEAVIERYG